MCSRPTCVMFGYMCVSLACLIYGHLNLICVYVCVCMCMHVFVCFVVICFMFFQLFL